jgi:tRNA (guanine-N7-)-methyltransferase
MIKPVRMWTAGRELGAREIGATLGHARERGRVELEIGFGKGRYLLARAGADPATTFVGIEAASFYWTQTSKRAERLGLANVITLCGDALYLLASCIARESADAAHVYFPDPWPKTRHQRRRLLDPTTVDLVIGVLAPGGELSFATDHAEYGAAVLETLESYPAVDVTRVDGPWPDGARTHYETKYAIQGRPILRLVVTRLAPSGASLLHPDGETAVAAGTLDRAVE